MLRYPQISISNTGQDFDFNKSKIKNITSIYLTDIDFELTEAELQNENSLFAYFASGDIFPLHNVFSIDPQSKAPEYSESLQDYTYKSYPGKDVFKLKYNWRLDYQQLVSQFEGQNLRVIFGIQNKYYLTTQSGSNIKGFALSNVSIEDIELFASNLSPILLELADKEERKTEVITLAGYPISNIDRRFVNVSVTATISTMQLNVDFLGTAVTSIIAGDVTVTDDTNGVLSFNFTTSGLGYLLDSFSDTLTRGCVSILSEGYLGNNRYIVEAVVPYDNLTMMSGDNFVFMSGDNFVYH